MESLSYHFVLPRSCSMTRISLILCGGKWVWLMPFPLLTSPSLHTSFMSNKFLLVCCRRGGDKALPPWLLRLIYHVHGLHLNSLPAVREGIREIEHCTLEWKWEGLFVHCCSLPSLWVSDSVHHLPVASDCRYPRRQVGCSWLGGRFASFPIFWVVCLLNPFCRFRLFQPIKHLDPHLHTMTTSRQGSDHENQLNPSYIRPKEQNQPVEGASSDPCKIQPNSACVGQVWSWSCQNLLTLAKFRLVYDDSRYGSGCRRVGTRVRLKIPPIWLSCRTIHIRRLIIHMIQRLEDSPPLDFYWGPCRPAWDCDKD